MIREEKISGVYVQKHKRKHLFTMDLELKMDDLRRWKPFIEEPKKSSDGMREMEIAALKAKIKRQVRIDKAEREANLKKWPQPRYDELYFEAVAWLDENG